MYLLWLLIQMYTYFLNVQYIAKMCSDKICYVGIEPLETAFMFLYLYIIPVLFQ